MSDLNLELELREIKAFTAEIADTLSSIDESLEGSASALWTIANVGRLAASLMDGGAINVREHTGLCIGAPLGLQLTPSQCDEIGKYVAESIRSGALKLTKPLAAGVCGKCGCTAEKACAVPGAGISIDACHWVNVEETLCSACVSADPATAEAGKEASAS